MAHAKKSIRGTFDQITYNKLKPRQKEVYNFHHVAAVLSEYGFACYMLDDDWQGADFLAYHMLSGETLKVQLKSRVSLGRKYIDKDIWMAFPIDDRWCLIPHDLLMQEYETLTPTFLKSETWTGKLGRRSMGKPTKKLRKVLEDYLL